MTGQHPAEVAASILTAQSIAHHRLAELGDASHDGVPADCIRPLCARLRADAEAVADFKEHTA